MLLVSLPYPLLRTNIPFCKSDVLITHTVYFTAAAQHPPHQIKFDFYYMHCVNSSIFFPTFMSTPSLSTTTKIRLLEWKVRLDLAMYASRASPRLLLNEITNYQPTSTTPLNSQSSWDDIIKRVNRLEDDGHASKLVRALKHGEEACKEFEGGDGFVVRGDMWRVLGGMVVDSVEAGQPKWVRSCGFEEAWTEVPERDSARL